MFVSYVVKCIRKLFKIFIFCTKILNLLRISIFFIVVLYDWHSISYVLCDFHTIAENLHDNVIHVWKRVHVVLGNLMKRTERNAKTKGAIVLAYQMWFRDLVTTWRIYNVLVEHVFECLIDPFIIQWRLLSDGHPNRWDCMLDRKIDLCCGRCLVE